MLETLNIRKIADGLLIRSRMQHGHLQAIISAIVSATFFVFVVRFFFSSPILVLCGVAIAGSVFGYLEVMRFRTAELRATNLEFQTTFSGLFRSAHSVPRANIRWLEYRDEGGGSDSYATEGLYAVLNHGSKCILPYLSPQQTDTVIDALYRQFPDMLSEGAEPRSPFGEHFTTLGLQKSVD